MHASAIQFALRYSFRLGRAIRPNPKQSYYYLTNAQGEHIDTPATKAHTAAAAIRMMRRHLRLELMEARAI